VFLAIFVFFSITSHGKMFSPFNLQMLVEQSMLCIIVGCGAIFIVAQGSIDLSIGVNLALSGVVSMYVALASGHTWLIFPIAILVGIGVGLFNGFVVSRCKVSSFMVTIALLIALRGIVNYIQSIIGMQSLPPGLAGLNAPIIKYPLFLVIVAIMVYLFEFTKSGKYSKAIGENELTARASGVPVVKVKMIAFALSGLMAGIAALFTMITLGGTNTTMGVFFEMDVATAIYLGGILVAGGSSAKIYKVFLGSFTVKTIRNGLALMGLGTQVYEIIQGVVLISILIVTAFVHWRFRETSGDMSDAAK
jgi:ribose transport system permease protein